MASRYNFPKRIDNRRAEAKLRNEERAKRGDKGQLERLISKGFGHCKEAKRLTG